MVIWFTGMSGSGKSTLTESLRSVLQEKGFSICVIDGDFVRKLNKTVNHFTVESILKNNYSIIEECLKTFKLFDFVIVSVISPYRETRKYAKKILGKEYFEIFVKCSLETLIKRDTKGLYHKAILGEIDNLIGFSEKLHYEEPLNSDLVIRTDQIEDQEAVRLVLNHLPISD
jgi:adenylylsulfate kinase